MRKNMDAVRHSVIQVCRTKIEKGRHFRCEMRFAVVFTALAVTMTSPHISEATVRVGSCPRDLEAVDALDSAQVSRERV